MAAQGPGDVSSTSLGVPEPFKQRGAFPLRQRIWDEVSEYYTQIFSGVAAEATEKHLDVAKSVLDNFDAVLILERLSTEEGRDEAEALLRKILPTPASSVRTPRAYPCTRSTKGACGSEEPLSREDRLRIVALNPLDLELYRHAVTVHKERVVEVMGPCRIRTNCTSVRDRDLNLIWGEGAYTKLRADGLPPVGRGAARERFGV